MTDVMVKVVYPDKTLKYVMNKIPLSENEYRFNVCDLHFKDILEEKTMLMDSTTGRAVNSLYYGDSIYSIRNLKDLEILNVRLKNILGPWVYWDYYTPGSCRKTYGLCGNIKNLIEV